MNTSAKHDINIIVDRILSGAHFALFNNGKDCYFENGEKITYTDLWAALRLIHHLPLGGHNKTLLHLCPDTFEGTFDYKFSKHKWYRHTFWGRMHRHSHSSYQRYN